MGDEEGCGICTESPLLAHCPCPRPVPAGAIVVDGVVASELTSVVPPALAGAVFQRGMAAALRAACTLLPPHLVEAAVRGVASWAHGTPDASISHAAMAASGASRA